MKNRVRPWADMDSLVWTNGTGSDVSAGNNAGSTGVVWTGRRWAIAMCAIVAAAAGTVYTGGVFNLKKQSADVMVQGQRVWWDATNSRLSMTPVGIAAVGEVHEAAASGTTKAAIAVYPSPPPLSWTSTGASTAVSNTTTETAFDTYTTIPANTLQAGDRIRIPFQVIATSTNSTDTLALKVYLGATEVLAIAAVDVASNDITTGYVEVSIRTIGASGTCVAMGWGITGASGTGTERALFKASQAIDTTAALDVKVKATWSVASASNSCRLDNMGVEIV